ncbi:MAG: hypothetical protein QF718_10180 [Phycisphaerales bacterium]|jgi:hypothetical protein|nr:hypothetical protein [Phycisphaerales bacterium]
MKIVLLTSLVLSTSLLTGCQNTSRLGNIEDMPSNWLSIKSSAWQVKQLPEISRNQLASMRSRLAEERKGQYYSFFGTYKPDTLEYIQSTSSELDQAYLGMAYSSNAILSSLTPNMHGPSETHTENKAGIAVTNNTNHRMMHEDGNRFLLLDKPSTLTPMPIVRD